MKSDVTFRPAEPRDVDFCVETIVMAEKSRTDKFSYEQIFDMPESELRRIFREIILEDISGQELALSSFLVGEIQGMVVGAVACWPEILNDTASSLLKANVLSYYIPPEKFSKAMPLLEKLSHYQFEHEPDSIQFSSIYVSEEYRTLDLLLEFILRGVVFVRGKYPKRTFRYMAGEISNSNAFLERAYRRIKIFPVKKIMVDDPDVLKVLPGNSRLYMRGEI